MVAGRQFIAGKMYLKDTELEPVETKNPAGLAAGSTYGDEVNLNSQIQQQNEKSL